MHACPFLSTNTSFTAGREYDKKTGCPSVIFLPCKASFAADLGWEPDLLPTPEEMVTHQLVLFRLKKNHSRLIHHMMCCPFCKCPVVLDLWNISIFKSEETEVRAAPLPRFPMSWSDTATTESC